MTIDVPPDYFDASVLGPSITLSGQEGRPIAEFDLTSLPASHLLKSATLRFRETLDQGMGTQIQVHGYLGDGIGSASDFLNITNPIGPAQFNDGNTIVESLDVTDLGTIGK